MTGIFIGNLRYVLLLPWSSRWNAFIRDITAKHEGSWLICSKGFRIQNKLKSFALPETSWC